jgi:general stress protein 26
MTQINETAQEGIRERSEALPIDIGSALRFEIRQGDVGMLTACDPEGQLHARPMSVRHVDEEGRIFFLSNDSIRKSFEATEHTDVTLSFHFPKRLHFSALRASACLRRDAELLCSLWGDDLLPWVPLGASDPNLVVIELSPETYDMWEGLLHTRAARVP